MGLCTTFKILIGMSPYQLIFGNSFNLHVELEHKVIWALMKLKLDWDAASRQRLNELDEFLLKLYESSDLYSTKGCAYFLASSSLSGWAYSKW